MHVIINFSLVIKKALDWGVDEREATQLNENTKLDGLV